MTAAKASVPSLTCGERREFGVVAVVMSMSADFSGGGCWSFEIGER